MIELSIKQVSQISTSDVDGNGFDDIIHSDGQGVFVYYNW